MREAIDFVQIGHIICSDILLNANNNNSSYVSINVDLNPMNQPCTLYHKKK